MLIAALFQIVKTQKQCKCPSADEWKSKMWYISHTIQWDIIQHENGSADTCYNMDKSQMC